MNVPDAIRERRSVRMFLDRPIPGASIDAPAEAVRWAPSTGNLQARFQLRLRAGATAAPRVCWVEKRNPTATPSICQISSASLLPE
ncbi:MAG: nitroreductase family protein [Deltaproteobacteria bacterium]|nr:nitroreductase family protein [Deltaproteobacteria bacterium]